MHAINSPREKHRDLALYPQQCCTQVCAEFCVHGQATAKASQPVSEDYRNHPKKLRYSQLSTDKKPRDLIGESGLIKHLSKLPANPVIGHGIAKSWFAITLSSIVLYKADIPLISYQ